MKHATRDAIEAFVLGAASEADGAELRRHVAECPECARRLATEARRELVLHESALAETETFERSHEVPRDVRSVPAWLQPLALAAALAVVAVVAWNLKERGFETAPSENAPLPVESVAEVHRLPGPPEAMLGFDVMSPGDLCRDVSVPPEAIPGL